MPVSQSAILGNYLRVLVYTIMYSGVFQQQNNVVYNYTGENHSVQPFFIDLTSVRPNKEMGSNLANWSHFS